MDRGGYQTFGPFQIVRTLGRGGMGEVFVARTPWAHTPVAAVKRLRPDVARVPTFAERFQHESELAVRLDHDNVVGTLDVGAVNGQLYVASELVLGKDTGIIADRLRARGQGGPAAVAIRLLLDVLAGLAYVHQARDLDGAPLELVHRDITPGNVLVGYDGVARLADFGLAKSLLTEASNLTQQGEILGTPHYLAPEIIRGESATASSDLYGLGAVMYRFLTGVAPYSGSTTEVLLKVLSEDPRPLGELRPDLSPWLVTFVHGLLTKSTAHRPSDARTLAAKLSVDANAAGLLVPRDAVARWLGDLFTVERAQEFKEHERLAAMTSSDVHAQSEGTVVLAARPRSGARFRADVIELDEPDGMPTQAVRIQPRSSAFLEASGTHVMAVRPGALPSTGAVDDVATHAASLASGDDDAPTAVPGFIDPGPRPPSDPLGATRPDPARGSGRRAPPRGPGAVDVAPLTSSAIRTAFESSAAPPPPRSPARRLRGAGTATPATAGGLAHRRFAPGRHALLLAAMLVVAVLLGILVGALVVSYRAPGVAVMAPRPPLRDRLFRVQGQLVDRVERGEVVPAEVWSKVTSAHAALKAGDEATAEDLLNELESAR